MFGTPIFLDSGCLPTKASIFNHSLAVKKKKEAEGVWRHNTVLSDVVKVVREDVKNLWDKTSIPNYFDTDPGKADRKVLEVLKQGRILLKTPISRRDTNFASNMSTLLDMSLCNHEDVGACSCPAYHKAPASWVDFLQDQRGPRIKV